MSVSTTSTHGRPSVTVSTPSLRVRSRAVRMRRGLGVVAAVLAVSAAAVALPMSSPRTANAQRTLAAEQIQDLAGIVQQTRSAQPVFEPQLHSMLPLTARAPVRACGSGC